jgi:uncharacterized protein (TIGR01244 family)
MTFAKVTKVTETLSVATQPDLADFETFAKQGYVALINNRPDGEEPAQPDSSAEQVAAHAAGLEYRHIPVTGADLTIDDVRAFQAALAAAAGPVLAHCKSGTRSLTLYAIGEALDGRLPVADVRSFGAGLGFDLRGAEAWLARHQGRSR